MNDTNNTAAQMTNTDTYISALTKIANSDTNLSPFEAAAISNFAIFSREHARKMLERAIARRDAK